MKRTPGGILFVIAVAACSGNPRPGTQDLNAGALVWPPPPEVARISYVGQLASDRDLGKRSGFLERLKNGILGTEEQALLAKRPFDTFVDENGRVYVTNGALSAVLVLDPDRQEADILAPEGPGALAKPLGMDGDRAGTLYLADPVQRRAVALSYDGEFLRAYGGRDLLLNPVDVAVSPDGDRVYVADSYLHQVLIFDTDGALVGRIGKNEGALPSEEDVADPDLDSGHSHSGMHAPGGPSDVTENRGNETGEFRYPSFLEVAADGTLYVSDAANYRVQVFDRDGEFIRVIGRHGDVPGAMARPKGVAVDSDGHVYVVDAAFGNVQIFDPDGRLLLAFGSVGTGPGGLWLPSGLSIDDEDRIYVADRYNDRVQVFQYHGATDAESGPAEETSPESPAPPSRGEG